MFEFVDSSPFLFRKQTKINTESAIFPEIRNDSQIAHSSPKIDNIQAKLFRFDMAESAIRWLNHLELLTTNQNEPNINKKIPNGIRRKSVINLCKMSPTF